MDLKRLITQVSYRIEDKPGGGCIAHPYGADATPLEAPNRFELNKLIQARTAEALAREFPNLKLSPEEKEQYHSFHIERRSDGGFTVHSMDPNLAGEAGSHEEVESHLAEKVLGFMAKRMADKLPPEMAAQLASGDVKVTFQRTTFGRTKSGMSVTALGQGTSPIDSVSPTPAGTNSLPAGTFTGDSPIMPEPSRSWPIFRFLLATLAVLLFVYIFLHRR